MTSYSWAVALLCLLPVAQGGKVYTNYQVIRVVPFTDTQVLQLRALELRQTCHQLDFWTSARTVGKAVDIMVPPTAKDYIKFTLDIIKAPYSVTITNVDEIIQTQRYMRRTAVGITEDAGFFEEYRTYMEIQVWTIELQRKYEDLLSEIYIGSSYENRPIRVLKISTGIENAGKKEVWFEGGIHAREWISPATVMYITNKLLEDYTNDVEAAVEIIENYDIYVLFVTNPDGYNYTWEEERLWRKTRSPNEGSECVGTDPNRNWPYEWGGEGASTDPCSETYRGTSPTSEPEIKSIVDYLPQLTNLQLFIDFHSYSQLVLYPWAYSEDAPPILNEDEVDNVAAVIADGIKSVYGTEYTYGSVAKTLYAASGSSIDYTYYVGAEFSYTIELPDTGEYGFLLPEEDIIPTGEETYAGILAAFRYLLANTK